MLCLALYRDRQSLAERDAHAPLQIGLSFLLNMQRTAQRGGATNRAKGENAELRADLNSQYRDPRKEAIKRVIASMTGQLNDISRLA